MIPAPPNRMPLKSNLIFSSEIRYNFRTNAAKDWWYCILRVCSSVSNQLPFSTSNYLPGSKLTHCQFRQAQNILLLALLRMKSVTIFPRKVTFKRTHRLFRQGPGPTIVFNNKHKLACGNNSTTLLLAGHLTSSCESSPAKQCSTAALELRFEANLFHSCPIEWFPPVRGIWFSAIALKHGKTTLIQAYK